MMFIDAYVITHLKKWVWWITEYPEGADTEIDEFYPLISFVMIFQKGAIFKLLTTSIGV